MDNELDEYKYDDSTVTVHHIRHATKLECALLILMETIISEVPESQRYGIDLAGLEEMIYRR